MAPPPATIVIPLLRREDAWLAQAVESALAQTVACEVVVVVSPGTPASNHDVLAAAAGRHTALRIIEHGANGFPGTVNAGIRAASAARVGLLFSDDWLEPDSLEACLALDADIVASSQHIHAADGSSGPEHRSRLRTMEEYCELPTLERRAAYLSHFFLMSREKVLAAGGLDEGLGDAPGIDDYDLIWVLLERGATVGIVPRRLYHNRDHAGERLTLRPPAEQLRTLERILDKHGVSGAERTRILREHGRWYGRPIAEARRAIDAARGA